MARISVLTAALLIISSTENVSAAQAQKTAKTASCTQEEFMVNCHRKGDVKFCEWWWDKQQRMGGNCMRLASSEPADAGPLPPHP